MVAKQLLEHFYVHNLDNPYQLAYKAGHPTKTALLSIKNEIQLSLSRGEPIAVVLLNLSAAFNTIDHSTHLSYLRIWFGISGSVLKWFISYLTECYQCIKMVLLCQMFVNSYLASPKVLSWVLYCSHCRPPNLSLTISKYIGMKFHFYADDSQVYVH